MKKNECGYKKEEYKNHCPSEDGTMGKDIWVLFVFSLRPCRNENIFAEEKSLHPPYCVLNILIDFKSNSK